MGNLIKNKIAKVVLMRFEREKPVLPHRVYKDVLGVPKKTFSQYLNNEKQPRLDELDRIAKWLNTPAKELF